MPKINRRRDKPEEYIEISFLGLKFKCSNPTSKAIIILVILLTFFAGMAALAPHIGVLKWFSG
jgi:hypothetical protein